MTLSVSTIGDNAQVPGVRAETYVPDQLIAGRLPLVTDSVTITGSAALKRGSVLGLIALGAVSSAAKSGGNTGNGTAVVDVTTPLLANAEAGIYTLRCTVAGTNSATFRLVSPKGSVLGDFAFSGSGASVTTNDRIKVAITDGSTDFIVGDGFDITVVDATATPKYKLAASAAVDGSQNPVAILADDVDATSGDVTGGIYKMGEFNTNALTFGTGVTAGPAKLALAPLGIFLKTAVSASDPT